MAECQISECPKIAKSRGWCASHLERWRRYGDPLFVTPRQEKIDEKIFSELWECVTCGAVKPRSEFAVDRSRPAGRRSSCSDCCGKRTGEWRSRSKSHLYEYGRGYRANRTGEQRAKHKESVAEWRRNNRGKLREYTFRRRALKANSSHGEIDYDRLWLDCVGECPDCGTALSRKAVWPSPSFASIDHIVPLSKGGGHFQENLRYCCLTCNMRKGAKVPF